ncbi:hypothetical protein [Motilibacter aurantiacus]|uniref:hypothetical protein n=1 Tax=Motilibacter aurantiacus TaxID=2714955 RepID=UPI00140C403E|nr:hypothetical protein [Motilibacter aurantiacus]NHC46623.1 hypothetical protein [Motilibacter aurantiacus]
MSEETPTERRLRAALAARAESVRGGDLVPAAVPPRPAPRWIAPAVAAALLGVIAGGVTYGAHEVAAPEPGASGSASPDPRAWDTPLTFAGVTVDVPAGWVAEPYGSGTTPSPAASGADLLPDIAPDYVDAACLHAPGTRGGGRCDGGVVVLRLTAESAAGSNGYIQFDSSQMSTAWLCMDEQPTPGQEIRTPERVGEGPDQVGSRPAERSRLECPDGKAYVEWHFEDTDLVLRADAAEPDAVAAARAARIEDAAEPTTMNVPTQGNGLTLTVPLDWTDFSRAADCVGPGPIDRIQTCPVDGVLVRGKAFFTGEGGVPSQGGAVTPDPESVLGYVPTPQKLRHDIPSGCNRLAGAQFTTAREAGTTGRTLVDSGDRTVGGKPAEYWAWETECADGTSFTWRRWWVPAEQTMVDSYDLPGGGSPADIDDLLESRTAWGEDYG